MFPTRDVARLLGAPTSRVRALVRDGWVTPERDAHGGMRFDFQAVNRLKRAFALSSLMKPRTAKEALARFGVDAPFDRFDVVGGELVVRDDHVVWEARTGQLSMFPGDAPAHAGEIEDFPAPRGQVLAFPGVARGDDPLDDVDVAPPGEAEPGAPATDDEWFELGCDLVDFDDDGAIDAFRRVLGLSPWHTEARIALGRLLAKRGDDADARRMLEVALGDDPGHSVGWLALGEVLERQSDLERAVLAYEECLDADAWEADAHAGLARCLRRQGKDADAERHEELYRRLTEDPA